MGSEFLERNKRKSALAALLLIFRGRAKYVAILLVAGVVSVPFVVSGDRLNSIMAFPAVAAVLRTVGLGGMIEEVSNSNTPDMLAASGNRVTGGMKESFWEKYLRAANAPLPPASATSTMAMLRGGREVLGPAVIKDEAGAKPAGPGDVKGAVNAEERANGENADGVSLEGRPGQTPGGAGATGGDGIYGNLMGENLGNRQGSGSGPYLGAAVLGAGGTVSKTSAMYSRAMDKSSEKVPVPGAPKKSNVKMGKIGNFAWKNMGNKSGKSQAMSQVALHNRKPMFQLSETFTMTTLGFGSGTPEYEAAYTGATYDGNDVDADFLQGDAIVPATPSASFAGLLGGVDALQQKAAECTEATGKEGVEMGNTMGLLGKRADTIDTDDPPWCCDSDVDDWNDTSRALYNYCIAYTTTAAVFDSKCQTTTAAIDCHAYIDMYIDPCSWLYCIFAWIVCSIIGSIFGLLGLVAVVANACGWNLFGDDVTGFIDGILTWVTGDRGVDAIPPE